MGLHHAARQARPTQLKEVRRAPEPPQTQVRGVDSCSEPEQIPKKLKVNLPTVGPGVAMWKTSSNSIRPFCTMEKPSCGYFFSRSTDNKKRLGIPSTNTVKYRNSTALNHAILKTEPK